MTPCGMFGRQETTRSFFHRGILRIFLNAAGQDGENLPRNRSWLQKLLFISKGHITRWGEKLKTETCPGLF